MRLLLDTNVLLFFVLAPERISGQAQRALADGANTRTISAVSAWEIATKVAIGRLDLPYNVEESIRVIIKELRADALSVGVDHAVTYASLPLLTRDPFDRMLVAQAIAEDMTLVTSDRELARYDVRTIW